MHKDHDAASMFLILMIAVFFIFVAIQFVSNNSDQFGYVTRTTRQYSSGVPINTIIYARVFSYISPMTYYNQGKYSYSPTAESGSFSVLFNVPAADEYVMRVNIMAPSVARNSFYVTLDNQAESSNVVYDAVISSVFVDDYVRLNGYNPTEPMRWSLTPGLHKFVFHAKDPNVNVKYIELMPAASNICEDADHDSYGVNCVAGPDCNDNDSAVHTTVSCNFDGQICGAFNLCVVSCPVPPAEKCDKIDNDCDGFVDEGCPYCGDGSCNNGETCSSCSLDCGSCAFCGDGSCNNGETCSSCSQDCGSCPNIPPTIYISSPLNGSSYIQGTNVTVTAIANDSDGMISSVYFSTGFYNESGGYGAGPFIDTIPPYQLNLSLGNVGTYVVTAEAFDNLGASASAIVTVYSIPLVCTNGQTQPCNTGLPGVCAPGTKTCVNNAWSSCIENQNATAEICGNGIDEDCNGADLQCPNVPPNVSISYPVNGQSFFNGTTLIINATASDSDGNVTRVDFYRNSTFLGSDSSSPFSYSWTSVPAGDYSLTARAYDDDNNITISSAIVVHVVVPNVLPTVFISYPVNGQSFFNGTTILINATASDSDGTIGSVEFYRNGTLIFNDTSSPFSAAWTNLSLGAYGLTARATDNKGAATISSVINVNVISFVCSNGQTRSCNTGLLGVCALGTQTCSNNQWGSCVQNQNASVEICGNGIDEDCNGADLTCNIPPNVSIVYPLNGATFNNGSSITVNATPNDSDGSIVRVEFYRNGTLFFNDTSSPYFASWNNALSGVYSWTARAVDNVGAGALSAVVNIIINASNVLPTVFISYPVNGQSFFNGTTILINATASDSDGTVSWVEFYRNNTLIFNDTSSPFSAAWTNLSLGAYGLTARAVDNKGAATISSVINVNVISFVCSNGQVQSCGTGLQGICAIGNQTCNNNTWQTCIAPTPQIEICGNGIDEDCNGADLICIGFAIDTIIQAENGNNSGFTISNGYVYTAIDENNSIAYTFNVPVTGQYVVDTGMVNTTGSTDSFYIGLDGFNARGNNSFVYDGLDGTGVVNDTVRLRGPNGNSTYFMYDPMIYNLTAGSHTFRFYGRESNTKMDYLMLRTYTGPGNMPPNVSITHPLNGSSYVNGSYIVINATASDNDGNVTKVEFYKNGTLLGTAMSSPYTYNWASVPAGDYSLTAKAYDDDNATRTSAAVLIHVVSPNVPPNVAITYPTNGATFNAGSLIIVNATASDNDGTISRVEFYRNGTLFYNDTNYPYSANWTIALAGAYAWTARAVDNSGAGTTSSVVNVIINATNIVPTVTITYPANGAILENASTINVNATANDTDGNIARVEFFRNGTLLYNDSSIPFSATWTNAAIGAYSLTARAVDNNGAGTTSSTVYVNVVQPKLSRSFASNPVSINTNMNVTLLRTLLPNETVILVEEYVPAGITIVSAVNGSISGNTIRWALLDNASTGPPFKYIIHTPGTAGTYTFDGVYSINGDQNTPETGGAKQLVVQ